MTTTTLAPAPTWQHIEALQKDMEKLMEVVEKLNRRVQLVEDALALEKRINAATRGRINSHELAS